MVSCRCYGRALKLLPDCAQLWHDLGFSLYQQSLRPEVQDAGGVAAKSAEALKKGLSLAPANYQIWNTLGLVYCNSGQHLLYWQMYGSSFYTSIKVCKWVISGQFAD